MKTDFLLLDLPLIIYAGGHALQTEEATTPVSNFVLPPKVCSTLHHAASLDEISQYYVLLGKQDKLDFIVYDTPRDDPPVDHSWVNVAHCRPFSLLEPQVNLIIWEQRCLCTLTGILICWKIC